MELREARATLQTAGADAERAESALRAAIAEATTRRDQSKARNDALKQEKRALRKSLELLATLLEEKRKEDALLARGAVLRDQYVDWNPADRRNAVQNGMTVGEVKVTALILGSLFLTWVLYLWIR